MLKKSDSKASGKTDSKIKIVIFWIIVVVIFNLTVRLIHIRAWNYARDLFTWDSKPLMTTQDAYYYLRLAEDYKKGNFDYKDELSPVKIKPYPISLLAFINASASRITGLSLEKIAFYLPVFFSCFMILVYLAWGMSLWNIRFFVISASIGSVVFYWYTRTCLGRFDTDSLIPFFTYIIPYFVYKFTTSSNVKFKVLNLFLTVLTSLLFICWWIPAKYLIMPLVFFTYSLSVFTVKSSKIESTIKVGILILSVVGIVFFILAYFSIIPRRIVPPRMIGLLDLITHRGMPGFPDVSKSISELASLSFSKVAIKIANSKLILAFSLIGLLWLIKERIRIFLFLSVPVSLAILSLKASRLLIFYTPLFAMGIAFMICKLSSQKIIARNKVVEYTMAIVLTTIVLYLTGFRSFKYTIPPKPTSHHVSIAKSIYTGYDPQEVIWSWWDYGYFLEYITKKRTFADGGSQDPLRVFITAFPLAQKDYQVAAGWIRLFAIRDVNLFWSLKSFIKSEQKTVEFIKSVFTSPENLETYVKQYKLPSNNWKQILFPEGRVYLYLPFDMINKSGWWFYFGTWDFNNKEGKRPFVRALPMRFWIDNRKGVVLYGTRQYLVKDILEYTTSPRVCLYLAKDFGNPSNIHLIKGKSINYLVDSKLLDSLLIKLLFNPSSTPYFKLIKYLPNYGGIWEVLKIED